MADSKIPTEALRAAERVLASLDPERDAGSVRRLVHNLLTAAAPYLIAEGRRQAAKAIRAAAKGSPLVTMRGGDVGFGAAQAYDSAAQVAERSDG